MGAYVYFVSVKLAMLWYLRAAQSATILPCQYDIMNASKARHNAACDPPRYDDHIPAPRCLKNADII